MADYQKMYSMLFNAVTDTIAILQRAQQATEEQYISANEPVIRVLAPTNADSNGENKTE